MCELPPRASDYFQCSSFAGPISLFCLIIQRPLYAALREFTESKYGTYHGKYFYGRKPGRATSDERYRQAGRYGMSLYIVREWYESSLFFNNGDIRSRAINMTPSSSSSFYAFRLTKQYN